MGESQLGGRGIPGSYGSMSEAGRHEATVSHKGFLQQRQTFVFRMLDMVGSLEEVSLPGGDQMKDHL